MNTTLTKQLVGYSILLCFLPIVQGCMNAVPLLQTDTEPCTDSEFSSIIASVPLDSQYIKSYPLHSAILHQLKEAIQQIVTQNPASVNTPDSKGQTPLHLAAYHNLEQITSLFIKNGANVNQRDKCGNTALHLATFSGAKTTMLLLIEAKADINALNKRQVAPLHYAAYNNKTECCRILLEAGAFVNITTKYGQTPLHIAAFRGNIHVIPLLIEFGADMNMEDNKKLTPLDCAIWQLHTEAERYLRQQCAQRGKNKSFVFLIKETNSLLRRFQRLFHMNETNVAVHDHA